MTIARPSTTTHAHAHASSGSRARDRRRLTLVLALVLLYAAVELVGGWLTGSLALLSDALHMVSDSAALALSLLAAYLAARPAHRRRTFGNSRVEILAALANGLALAVVALFISVHAVERWLDPHDVAGEGLLAIATGGLAINVIALFLLGHGHDHARSLNVRGAFLHVLSDTLASVGVCFAGLGIWLFGWLWLDPAVSLIVSALVLWSAWQLVRDALDILMEAVPAHLDLEEICEALLAVDGVRALHCLHVWTIGSGEISLSSHLVVDPARERTPLLEQVRHQLGDRFSIHHTTIQIEPAATSRPTDDAPPRGDCPDEACGPLGPSA
ncbi:MAG: cation diffusion facilitator family transporter [Myxococcota bacterium]